MSQFNLEVSFEIDEGELDGIPPHEVFTLGVEFHMLWSLTKREPKGMTLTVHTHNVRRLTSMLKAQGRTVTHRPTNTEGWSDLECSPRNEAN